MAYDNSHSRFVGWAKIVLPLIALVLLSTLFLLSNRVDPMAAIPYAEVDVMELVREPALIEPQYAGMTEDGSVLSLTARRAVPDPENERGASAEGLVAKLTAKSGFVADMTATSGVLDPAGQGLVLSEKVTLQTSTGYRIASERIDVNPDMTELVSPGAVSGEGPFGTLEAGRMELKADDNGQVLDLLFNERVKLVYLPPQ
ncbi:LPS export ABC transporter periplasmic protein LptC [Pseudothioclava arenosa]|uniref:LPS export ABC transporter periplasmic protein LptC n=1 Tax=Pseudothioclava arenosa TaxID=1795308 RepID=A0A2A4CQQ0_9RHOB|nr:LPS export ABC transporter periplasmic protein LptC [Pseudothioclava arenosa]PCD76446.1 hypothetical protein CLN94_09695 [Pseudothioclava arenosa]